MKTVSCVSDLHMFCRRSMANHHYERIEQSIAESDIFIFNGDTFDFRWSIHESVEKTVSESIKWLRAIIENAPHCQFYFILGNHDSAHLFVDALELLAQDLPNLEWHEYYLKLGSSLFLHGDVANRKMSAQDLDRYRKNWMHEEQRGEFQNRMHDWVFKLRLHKAVARSYFPTSRTLSRIQHYLNDIEHGEGSEITDVYFGHTHLRMDSIEFNGQRFTNGGAPMPGLDFDILKTQVN